MCAIMTSKSKELLSSIFLCLFLLFDCQLPKLQPGDLAPSFALQTLQGRIIYKKARSSSKTPKHPVIFHLYTKRSAFLRALWTNDTSLEALIEHSPGNTNFVFLTYSDSMDEVLWMRERLHKAIDEYFKRKTTMHGLRTSGNCNPVRNAGSSLSQDSQWHEIEPFLKLSRVRQRHVYKTVKCHSSQASQWKKRLYFASLPLYDFGNWIPYALMHWPCFGSGCALAQVAIKSKEGEVILVAERLDARYDWLPSPHTLLHKHGSHLSVDFYGNACHFNARWTSKVDKKDRKLKNHVSIGGRIALVAPGGQCTVFTKILHMSKAGVDAVLVYPKEGKPITELTCNDYNCFTPLHVAVSVISHKDGSYLKHLLMERIKLYASYQYTPQENYFLAIDSQGKLAEVGLFLYPSMKFLAYEAKWLNYKSDLVHNLTGSAKIIHVFNHTLMEGETGAVKTISLPSPEELRLYRNVELDMSLYCTGRSDYSCPHWDHVVHLTVCCDENNILCGEELGRWITPYRRAIGRWLTNITPLLPLFTSKTCTLRMKHPPWERAWKPSLNIRLSDHIKFSKHHYSGRQEDEFHVPYKITKLFHGGKFDKHYNKKYLSLTFKVQPETVQVKLVAIITGHGSDDNGCAEFCVTSHHFVINGFSNIKVFKNAATSMGCANRVADGVVPNEHGTWLYGRDGWCCGKDVVPWVVDVSKQVHFEEENKIRYFGWFNGTDPNPARDPGEIIMHSYLVFYKSVE